MKKTTYMQIRVPVLVDVEVEYDEANHYVLSATIKPLRRCDPTRLRTHVEEEYAEQIKAHVDRNRALVAAGHPPLDLTPEKEG
jgi:hypothetical protein